MRKAKDICCQPPTSNETFAWIPAAKQVREFEYASDRACQVSTDGWVHPYSLRLSRSRGIPTVLLLTSAWEMLMPQVWGPQWRGSLLEIMQFLLLHDSMASYMSCLSLLELLLQNIQDGGLKQTFTSHILKAVSPRWRRRQILCLVRTRFLTHIFCLLSVSTVDGSSEGALWSIL